MLIKQTFKELSVAISTTTFFAGFFEGILFQIHSTQSSNTSEFKNSSTFTPNPSEMVKVSISFFRVTNFTCIYFFEIKRVFINEMVPKSQPVTLNVQSKALVTNILICVVMGKNLTENDFPNGLTQI